MSLGQKLWKFSFSLTKNGAPNEAVRAEYWWTIIVAPLPVALGWVSLAAISGIMFLIGNIFLVIPTIGYMKIKKVRNGFDLMVIPFNNSPACRWIRGRQKKLGLAFDWAMTEKIRIFQ